jgi:hypothetical protein
MVQWQHVEVIQQIPWGEESEKEGLELRDLSGHEEKHSPHQVGWKTE